MTRLSPALFILALSGCAATNTNVSGEWDCPAQQGRACTTIEEADALSSHSSAPPSAVSVAPLPVATQAGDDKPVPDLPTGDDKDTGAIETAEPSELALKTPPVRRAEVLGKVWFYPFVDESNHYHEGGFVRVVLRPADWQTSPTHMFPKTGAPKGMSE
ncbi:MAG: TraV family lipoprotein [Sphingomonadales bacterium]